MWNSLQQTIPGAMGLQQRITTVTTNLQNAATEKIEDLKSGETLKALFKEISLGARDIRESISSQLIRWKWISNLLATTLIVFFVLALFNCGTNPTLGGYGSQAWMIPSVLLGFLALWINWNLGEMGYGKWQYISRGANCGLIFACLIGMIFGLTYTIKFSLDARDFAEPVRSGTFDFANSSLSQSILPGVGSPNVMLNDTFSKWIFMNVLEILSFFIMGTLMVVSAVILLWSPSWNASIQREDLFREKANNPDVTNGHTSRSGAMDHIRSTDSHDAPVHTQSDTKFHNWVDHHVGHDKHTKYAQSKATERKGKKHSSSHFNSNK